MKTDSIIKWCIERELTALLDVHWIPSKNAPLCLLIGDNATGKSLFRRVASAWCSKGTDKKMEMISLSMQDRSGGSYMGVARAMVYGDEHTNATGVCSGHTVTTGIKTSLGRESDHVLFWDEPDVGLSDSYAADVGRRIAEFSEQPGKHTQGIFVVTHRKALIQQLIRVNPHVLIFGENAPKTLEEFMTKPVEPADIEKLYERSLALFRKVSKFLNARKDE